MAWSPDGVKIALSAGPEIYLINADGSGLTQLAGDGQGLVQQGHGLA